jgi:prepilin-type N-terminal cleavage/methylation domain-containing protein
MRPVHHRGFTIIELLAAMAVLLIMVALLSRVFGLAATNWRNGNKRIESNNSGRTAIEFISRELAGLIISPHGPTMRLQSDVSDFLAMESDKLTFVSLNHTAEYRTNTQARYRDTQQIHYAVATNSSGSVCLYRWANENWGGDEFTCYHNSEWLNKMNGSVPTDFNGGVLADNVRNFEVFITPVGAVDPQENYDYATHGPPATIDVYLEVLAEEDAIRAQLSPGDSAFLNAATRRYATRIYVQNRAGYSE